MQNKPLADSQLKRINAALHTLTELFPQLDMAEQVGEDVSDLRRRAEHWKDKLLRVKSVYFPGKA